MCDCHIETNCTQERSALILRVAVPANWNEVWSANPGVKCAGECSRMCRDDTVGIASFMEFTCEPGMR